MVNGKRMVGDEPSRLSCETTCDTRLVKVERLT